MEIAGLRPSELQDLLERHDTATAAWPGSVSPCRVQAAWPGSVSPCRVQAAWPGSVSPCRVQAAWSSGVSLCRVTAAGGQGVSICRSMPNACRSQAVVPPTGTCRVLPG
jgi:hypothetical protein